MQCFLSLVNDFNTTILERVIPAGSTGYTTYIFEVDLFQDNIVEGNEVFLALLTVAGDPALSVIRNCTAIEVLEPPITGQCRYLTVVCIISRAKLRAKPRAKLRIGTLIVRFCKSLIKTPKSSTISQ